MTEGHRSETGSATPIDSHHGRRHGHAHEHDHAAHHRHGLARRGVLAGGLATAALTAGGNFHTAAAQSAEAVLAEIAERTRRYAGLLDPMQRRAGLYPFDAPARLDWHFVPRSRPGLAFRGMNAEQRTAAEALLRRVLSEEGFARFEGVRILEAILRGDSQSTFRDPENYVIAVFGTPGTHPWGLRLEGHHLSLNFTFAAPDRASVTPSFWGANPAEVRGGQHAGMRLLGRRTDVAFALVRSLDQRQRGEAVIGDRSLGDIVAGPGRGDELKQPRGLAYAAMTDEQRNQAVGVIEGMMAPLNADFRALQVKRLRESGLYQMRFAWAGGMERGRAYYFRLHGPVTLVEFDNTQDGANHIHSIWRDLTADFGADALGAHYRDGHKP